MLYVPLFFYLFDRLAEKAKKEPATEKRTVHGEEGG
jgi:hypothetical protein